MHMLRAAVFFGLLTTSQSAWALVVPDADCPVACPDREQLGLEMGCDVQHECTRTDGAVTDGNAGTASTRAGQSHSCSNCAGCPSNPPPPSNCIAALTVTFTCQVTVTIGTSVTVSAEVVESSLSTSLGFTNGQSVSYTINCGTSSFPACKRSGAYQVTLEILRGKTKRMAHTYQWKITPNSNCINKAVIYRNGGSDHSTIRGTVPDGDAECVTKRAGVDC